MNEFSAHFNVLPERQLALLPALSKTPSYFVLYGGTAIALRLGHRESVDFDYFSHKDFKPGDLLSDFAYSKDAEVIQRKPNTLSVLIAPDRDNESVHVSFFGDLSLQTVLEPEQTNEHHLPIASLLDLLGTKCATITDRIEAKDYIDIHAIITQSELTLSDGLAAGKVIYGKQFNPIVTLKALQYFEGGNLNTLEQDVKNDLVNAVKKVDIDALSNFNSLGLIGENAHTKLDS